MSDKRVDHHANKHLSSSNHESPSTTTLLNDPEAGNRTKNVDRSEDDGSNVGVRDTARLENGCTVVEEEIGTSQLLTGLKDHSEDGSV